MTSIILPWPPKELSPNARHHWRKLAPIKKKYRSTCAWECKAQGVKKMDVYSLHVSITFHPPDGRKRDLDNMLASIKSGLDGVADAVGVDDSNWTITITTGDPRGCVAVHLGEMPDVQDIEHRGVIT